jgi:hypothetical protein
LVGFVLSLIYGLIHKVWLDKPTRAVANMQLQRFQWACFSSTEATCPKQRWIQSLALLRRACC